MTRSVAFYLPQFHPIPENDEWWGEGFTEWRNVSAARPQFRGHAQPHVPTDLGHYDLLSAETRAAQAALAAEYGLSAFCYYHYWFEGRRLLHAPLDAVLESGEPDFGLLLCWANETWSRRWDGSPNEILIEQTYSDADDLAHIRWLCEVFEDPRYVRVDGRPVFLVYRVQDLPSPRRTAEVWRSEAARLGVADPLLCLVDKWGLGQDPETLGFDAAVEFHPEWGIYPRSPARELLRKVLRRRGPARHERHVYDDIVEAAVARSAPPYRRFPGVMPDWDNTARRPGGGVIVTGSTPERWETWVRDAVSQVDADGQSPALLFVNAWNEWAEGNHLEPDERWGRQYLEAFRRAVSGAQTPRR